MSLPNAARPIVSGASDGDGDDGPRAGGCRERPTTWRRARLTPVPMSTARPCPAPQLRRARAHSALRAADGSRCCSRAPDPSANAQYIHSWSRLCEWCCQWHFGQHRAQDLGEASDCGSARDPLRGPRVRGRSGPVPRGVGRLRSCTKSTVYPRAVIRPPPPRRLVESLWGRISDSPWVG